MMLHTSLPSISVLPTEAESATSTFATSNTNSFLNRTLMAAVNIGALPEYGRHQGVLRCTGPGALRQVDRTLAAAIAAASKVKLARKAQADDRMEVDSGKRRQSSDVRLSTPKVPPQFRSLLCFPTQWHPWNHRPPSRWPRAHFYHAGSRSPVHL
jgi:hypothetical protein